MTAEIALINRRAVTLAADSAISLVGNDENDVKIFNSAEKIFELCNDLPVGLMIYNNVDIMRAPLEILARNFRAKCNVKHATLAECAQAFIDYIDEHARNASAGIKDEAIATRVESALTALAQISFHRYVDSNRAASQAGLHTPTPRQVLMDVLNEELRNAAAEKQIESHLKVTWQQVVADHGGAIDKAIADAGNSFLGLEDADIPIVREIAARWLLSENLSDSHTGIVIAGYGDEGMYPALIAHEFDGFVAGHLRRAKKHEVTIEPGVQSVDIITFAQEDISKRLLDGVDPEIVNSVYRQLLGGLRAMRTKALANVGANERVKVEADFDAAAGDVWTGISRTVQRFVAKCNADFKSTVASMPKQEMAFFAEALVNTTAMKRRVSRDKEDVGGPVDVAVISRHEGFVWVKRKHYFEADRNPRFFVRRFGPRSEGGGQ